MKCERKTLKYLQKAWRTADHAHLQEIVKKRKMKRKSDSLETKSKEIRHGSRLLRNTVASIFILEISSHGDALSTIDYNQTINMSRKAT